MTDVLVVGAGVMGAGAALELAARGAAVTLVDPGPLPHPDAASTDISKLIRADYAKDAFYTELMERALPRWRAWNERFGAELFHETGLLVLSGRALEEGGFEGDSFRLLETRGHRLQPLDAIEIHARFPAWSRDAFPCGYYNPDGGWAESGRVVRALLGECTRAGVVLREGVKVRAIDTSRTKVDHVTTLDDQRIDATNVIVAAGAMTSFLLPELADRIAPIGQTVLHFTPADAAAFSAPSFLPWAADIARTGFYGFPRHEGVVKVANHGRGVAIAEDAPRIVPVRSDGTPEIEPLFRAFFARALPGLFDAPRVKARLCPYSDTFDGDFFVDRHPTCEGLVVASGGSGHAFKFAPVLGEMIADRLENKGTGEWRTRFRFREKGAAKREAARAE